MLYEPRRGHPIARSLLAECVCRDRVLLFLGDDPQTPACGVPPPVWLVYESRRRHPNMGNINSWVLGSGLRAVQVDPAAVFADEPACFVHRAASAVGGAVMRTELH